MALVKQAGIKPTRKLSAAAIGSAAIAVGGLILKNLAPGWYDPEVMIAITPIVVFALGYAVHDNDNTPNEGAT